MTRRHFITLQAIRKPLMLLLVIACIATPLHARTSMDSVDPAQIIDQPQLDFLDQNFRELSFRGRLVGPNTSANPAITISKAGDGLGAPLVWHNTVAKIRSPSATVTATRSESFSLPVRSSVLTSRYGMRRHPLSGRYLMHSGVDLAASTGSPVFAPSDGTVSYAGWRGRYGLLVALEHKSGFQTRFGHLSAVAVMPGQQVKRGELLGLVGSTGRSTGPHLHYEMRINGLALDPISKMER